MKQFQKGNRLGGRHGGSDKILFQIHTGDLCRLKGISKACLRRDIRLKKIDPSSLEDIVRWINEPRTRSNKGKPMPWLLGG